MARVVAVVSDLMLASRVTTALAAAGHEVEQMTELPSIHGRHKHRGRIDGADAIVADLDVVAVERLGALGVPALGFYQHTDTATKDRADAAGVTAVPRSRMVRELPELVQRLLAA